MSSASKVEDIEKRIGRLGEGVHHYFSNFLSFRQNRPSEVDLKRLALIIRQLESAKPNPVVVKNTQLLDSIKALEESNAALTTKLHKSSYRITHLLRYIEDLEKGEGQGGGVKELEVRLRKEEDRIDHLIGHIDKLEKEVSGKKKASTGYASKGEVAGSTDKGDGKQKKGKKGGSKEEGKENVVSPTKSQPAPPPPHPAPSPSQFSTEKATSPTAPPTKPVATPTEKISLIHFNWPYGGHKIELAGSFTNWNKVDLSTQNHSVFSLKRGLHQYKFIIDGEWKHDPSKPTCVDTYGGHNNFIII